MKDELFNELVASVREGGAILRGEAEPSRTFVVETPDVKAIRTRLALTQNEFASLLGISVRTVQNWEQGRRSPHGTARVLLQIAEKHPEVFLDVVTEKRSSISNSYGAPSVPVQAFREKEEND
jgi:putative transcriptional regulator